MQLITVISAATAMIAGASATAVRSAVTLNSACDKSRPHAKVVNRCNYPVYLWSVYKGTGCPLDGMVTLKNGESYYENLADPDDGVGISIKMAKETTCNKPTDIVQLEYFLERNETAGFNLNYLDISYVDCLGNDCPTKSEGYYLKAGNQTGDVKAAASDTWCPILSCTDAASCAKMSYILPDDVQTKTCALNQNMELYMCGGEAPDSGYDSDDDDSSYEPATPSQSTALPSYAASSSVVKSSSTLQAVVSSASKSSSTKTATPSSTPTYGDSYETETAAVTSVPSASSQDVGSSYNVKTEVVYVTATQYTHVKRHSHDHARRHQPFHG